MSRTPYLSALSERAKTQPRKGGKFVKQETEEVTTAPMPFGKTPLGVLPLTLFGRDFDFMGGPYLARPEGYVGVKMAEEISAPCHIDIRTRDFNVPPERELMRGVRSATFRALRGERIYVGCMAGRGRTGLFMATVAHLTGIDQPVGYVRDNYYPHAVETKEQERFVTKFDRELFRRDVMRMLVDSNLVDFAWLKAMSWADRKLWFKVRFLG